MTEIFESQYECEKTHRLLTPADPYPFEVFNPDAHSPMLILCDHASNYIPQKLNGLGVNPESLENHIGYDIGAAAVSRLLAKQLGARAVLSRFSRLVIDPNRYPTDDSSVLAVSDGVVIPRNQDISLLDRMLRIEELFVPYHNRVARELGSMRHEFLMPLVVSMHSFTPSWQGDTRPWHLGVLWNRDDGVASLLIDELEKFEDWCIGDNEPYHPCKPIGYSMEAHAEDHGYPHALLEIRQDLIADEAGQIMVAERLAQVFSSIMESLDTVLTGRLR